jgi:hypothetical protein
VGDYLNVGNAGFKAMIKEHYVDKTGLISFVNSKLVYIPNEEVTAGVCSRCGNE